jgi:hypothetical protein
MGPQRLVDDVMLMCDDFNRSDLAATKGMILTFVQKTHDL